MIDGVRQGKEGPGPYQPIIHLGFGCLGFGKIMLVIKYILFLKVISIASREKARQGNKAKTHGRYA